MTLTLEPAWLVDPGRREGQPGKGCSWNSCLAQLGCKSLIPQGCPDFSLGRSCPHRDLGQLEVLLSQSGPWAVPVLGRAVPRAQGSPG